jgi:hypothetical protein
MLVGAFNAPALGALVGPIRERSSLQAEAYRDRQYDAKGFRLATNNSHLLISSEGRKAS